MTVGMDRYAAAAAVGLVGCFCCYKHKITGHLSSGKETARCGMENSGHFFPFVEYSALMTFRHHGSRMDGAYVLFLCAAIEGRLAGGLRASFHPNPNLSIIIAPLHLNQATSHACVSCLLRQPSIKTVHHRPRPRRASSGSE